MKQKSRFYTARRILIFWTLFIGLGAVAGALGMLLDPSGKSMGMDAMLPYFQVLPFADVVFQDFTFSGWALLIVNGLTNLTAAGLLLAFACTTASPWRSVNEMLHGLLNYVQMPFRILTMASFFLALCSGDALCTTQTEKKKEARLWAALALCAVCVHPLLSDHALSTRILPYGREDFSSINLDYRLPNMDESTLEDTQIAVSDGAEITDFQKDGTRIVANIATEQAASLTVPLFAFDGYEAKLDGQALDWTQDDRARLTVRLPENARGRLEIRYVGKAIWRAADVVSAATLIGLLFWMKKGEKKACRTH